MDVKQLVAQLSSDETLTMLSQKLGIEDKEKILQATKEMLPTLLKGAGDNLKNKEKEEGFLNALDQHGDHFQPPHSFFDQVNLKDGDKILNHLLGKEKEEKQEEVAQKSGLSLQKSATLMMTLAPLLMAVLGKQKKDNGTLDISSLLKGVSSLGSLSSLGGLLSGFLNKK